MVSCSQSHKFLPGSKFLYISKINHLKNISTVNRELCYCAFKPFLFRLLLQNQNLFKMGKERVTMEFFAVQGKEKIFFDNIVVVDQGKEKVNMDFIVVDQGKEKSAMEIVAVDQGKEKSSLDFIVA